MTTRPRILLAAPDWPVPADHGGRIDILGRLRALAALAWDVDLLVASYDPPSEAQRAALGALVRTVQWVPRTRGWRAHADLRPYQIASRAGLAHAPLQPPYDLLLLESHYVAALLDHAALAGVRAALRVHNDEVRYFSSLARAEASPVRRAFYRAETWRFRRFETHLVPRIRHWLFLSADELARFRHRHPDADAHHLGPPWQPQPVRPAPETAGMVLWLGALFMPNNRHGLDWYLREVHPALLAARPAYRLVIAGNARGAELDSLRARAADAGQRVTLVESPAEVTPLYAEASLVVNPIFEGAGVKLKTINAFEQGVPLVSTSVGVEGIGLEADRHVLVADAPAAFIDAALAVLDDPDGAARRVEAGRAWLESRSDAVSVLASLLRPESSS